jgi:hypothetical protein
MGWVVKHDNGVYARVNKVGTRWHSDINNATVYMRESHAKQSKAYTKFQHVKGPNIPLCGACTVKLVEVSIREL